LALRDGQLVGNLLDRTIGAGSSEGEQLSADKIRECGHGGAFVIGSASFPRPESSAKGAINAEKKHHICRPGLPRGASESAKDPGGGNTVEVSSVHGTRLSYRDGFWPVTVRLFMVGGQLSAIHTGPSRPAGNCAGGERGSLESSHRHQTPQGGESTEDDIGGNHVPRESEAHKREHDGRRHARENDDEQDEFNRP